MLKKIESSPPVTAEPESEASAAVESRPGNPTRESSAQANIGRTGLRSRNRPDDDDSASIHSDLETVGQRRFPSHVAVDFFDPEGVNVLRRNLTGQSHQERSVHSLGHHVPARKSGDEHTIVSETSGPDQDKFDVEQYLHDLIRRGRESVRPRELGVVFQDLCVQGSGTTAQYQPTVSSALNPITLLEKIRTLLHPPVRNIISGFEGVVNPGEMLLVLGRPGAGCSTLLKVLSNQHDEYRSISGLLYFSGFTPKQVRKHFRGDVVYCPEEDIHFPTLTVQQTLTFALRTRMPNKRSRIGGASRTKTTEDAVNTLATIFGLRHAKNTRVGNAAVRGVSGGERKRVTIAEALATRARLTSWDNSTRGLDSSTALEFVRGLRIATDLLGLTSIVSIYQASELLYQLFDKVCLIYEGRMVYFGPARLARQYFIDQGWEPVNRQTSADFLAAVTDPNARNAREGFENRVPRTADEMAAAFQRHPLARENRREIANFLAENVIMESDPHDFDTLVEKLPNVPYLPREEKELKRQSYIQSAQSEHARHATSGSPYTISVASQIREVVIRRAQILRGDWVAQAVTIGSYVFLAIIMGTIFLKIPDATSAYFSRGSVLFFAILFDALCSMGEIASLYSQRPIIDRHARAAMYHPFTDAVALTIVDIPITVIRTFLFSVILYFLVRLQQTAGQFFTLFLFIVVVSVTMKAFFRLVASAFDRESAAQSLGAVLTLVYILYTGFTIPEPSMIGALKWITVISPLRYGFEAILTNEFHTLNGTCSQLVPTGPGYENVSLANQVCTTVGSLPGQASVDGNRFVQLSYGYSFTRIWRNFGIVIAFFTGFLVLLMLFTENNTSSARDGAVTLFKRGSRKVLDIKSKGADEEKGAVQGLDMTGQSGSAKLEQHASAPEPARGASDIFSWQNLRYSVAVAKGRTRLLLDSVSGYVVPGKLTALVGESGAGKTTLLNVLAGRTDVGIVTGDRFVNGQALPNDFQAQTGYCQQLDTHLSETTVREALLFSAKLRQPRCVPLVEKEAYVETCLKMCGLENYGDAIVGSLDMEHKKRTTIGVELAAKPKLLLFLDEPTTGLDSQSAWAIMASLRNLANHGQAILCTIHQPSSELFQMFDRLLLLGKGGQILYFGDLGKDCTILINYFEKYGARECEPQENPAEWMLDVIGAGATATSTIDWHDAWVKSEEAMQFQSQLEEIHKEGRKRPPVRATYRSAFAAPWMFQLYELTLRTCVAYWRNPVYILSKLCLNIAAGLLVGFSFFKAGDTVQGTQNKLFATFILTILGAANAYQIQTPFITFLDIYQVRERPSRTYSWTALLLSLLLVEAPCDIFGSALLFFCWYWTVGFETSRAGYAFLMLAVAFPLYYTTIAHAIAAMSPNAIIDSMLSSVLLSMVIVFTGVLQPYPQLGWWQWMYRISPFTYFIEGLLGQSIGGMSITCSATEFVNVEPPSGQTCAQYMDAFISFGGGYLQNPNSTSSCKYCAYRTADQFLGNSFDIFYKHHWRDFGFLVIFIGFNIIMIYVLTYLFRIRSWR